MSSDPIPQRPDWAPRISIEVERGCGFRKEGALYAIGARFTASCGRLPLPLMVCPTCHGGIKHARGWTWINPSKLAEESSPCAGVVLPGAPIANRRAPCPGTCPLSNAASIDRAGLIWVGEAHYADPSAFLAEAAVMGISRRLAQLPRDLEPGKTWCFLAHRKVFPGAAPPSCPACEGGFPVELERAPCCGREREGEPVAGLFAAFIVERVERVVPEDVSEAECAALRDRGIEPVIVRRA